MTEQIKERKMTDKIRATIDRAMIYNYMLNCIYVNDERMEEARMLGDKILLANFEDKEQWAIIDFNNKA